MKKLFTVIPAIFCLLSVFSVQNLYAKEITVFAASAILIDAETGQILYEKNAYDTRYPASITKILTTYLAVENGQMEEMITASKEAIDAVPRSASHIALNYGETLSVQDAVYAAMLASANDTCNVLAEYISGSMEQFADLMNETALLAGAKNTHFTNANGLPDDDHYTTAYDMAMITRYAMKNSLWLEVFGTQTYSMAATNLNTERSFAMGNQMILSTSENYYEYAIGGKTGWTEDAQYTMVTAAKKGDLTLIAVVLGCETGQQRYDDTLTLFEYGFNNYSKAIYTADMFQPQTYDIPSTGIARSTAEVSLGSDITLLLPANVSLDDITATVNTTDSDIAETFSAALILSYEDETLAEVPLDVSITSNHSDILLLVVKIIARLILLVLLLFLLLIIIVIIIGKRKGLKMRKLF